MKRHFFHYSPDDERNISRSVISLCLFSWHDDLIIVRTLSNKRMKKFQLFSTSRIVQQKSTIRQYFYEIVSIFICKKIFSSTNESKYFIWFFIYYSTKQYMFFSFQKLFPERFLYKECNFAKLMRKHLLWSPFYSKVECWKQSNYFTVHSRPVTSSKVKSSIYSSQPWRHPTTLSVLYLSLL